jgi:hypothetical protein
MELGQSREPSSREIVLCVSLTSGVGPALAERERNRFHSRAEKFDFELSINYWFWLSD